MTRLAIAPESEIAPGTVKGVQIRIDQETPEVIGEPQEQGPAGTVAVVVAHTDDDEWYAVGDLCTHGPVLLSEGEFEGCSLECWGHGSRFDVRTGDPENLPATQPVPTYPVTAVDGTVYIDIAGHGKENQ
jgi:3-phenylpropionate/trans-cinnamate dioxygenase ferredoxin subunit